MRMHAINIRTYVRTGRGRLQSQTANIWYRDAPNDAKPRPSVVEDRQVELTQTGGVGEHVDFDDLPVHDREAHDGKGPSTWSDDDSRRPVDQRRSSRPSQRGET